MTTLDLEPFYKLIEDWKREVPYMNDSGAGATECCISELREVLTTLEKQEVIS